jgi:glyoxylase-like metal-dependent hydrolase (beta-lactamase superfamily II)
MFLRQLFDPETSTYTYLVANELTKAAALIDPVLEQHERDLKLIAELGFHLELVLDTHVHADHITAANVLREKTGAKTVQSSRGAPCADVPVGHGDVVRLGDVAIHVLATPGHTDDSLSYLVDGHVFTGDTLLIRGTGRSDFQNGDASALFDSITRVLFALPDETVVLPGHDYRGLTQSTIGEEKRLNPRVAGKSRDEMVAIMKRLDLPPPKKLATAVPANRACGRVDQPH